MSQGDVQPYKKRNAKPLESPSTAPIHPLLLIDFTVDEVIELRTSITKSVYMMKRKLQRIRRRRNV